jgi:hypothetical protein
MRIIYIECMDLQEILGSLDRYISLNVSRLRTLKELCIGISEARSVNLQEVCSRFREGNFSSNTRRVERFFQTQEIDEIELARYVIETLFSSDEELVLAIDRTEWGFGDTWHNLLCLSVLYDKTAIPLVVKPLERKGNSDHATRIELLDKLLSFIPFYRIKVILGDREFIGDEWFKALEERYVPFVMRVRGNITIAKQGYIGLIDNLPVANQPTFHGKVHIGTRNLELSTTLSPQGELVAVISSDVKDPLTLYTKRWGIEVGFKYFKTGGYNIEDTHLKKANRIKLLMQICSLSMTLALLACRSSNIKSSKKNTAHRKILSSQSLNASS